jgi:hypothetical protein
VEIRILGVNGVGQESGNAEMCAGRVLPLLQDVAGVDAYTLWNVTYRDVVILDEGNRVVSVYNLTEHDLTNPANYQELHDLLVR